MNVPDVFFVHYYFSIIPTPWADLLRHIYPSQVLPVPPVVVSTRHRHIPNFGSQSFRDLVALRPVILQRLLYATNRTLLYNDIDMVWRQNAWNVVDALYRRSSSKSSYYTSSLLPEDGSGILLWTDGSHQLCSSLLYLEPSIDSHALLDKWQEEMRTGAHKNDQPALNAAVAALGSRDNISHQQQNTMTTTTTVALAVPPWKIIRDYDRFPHGSYYFGRVQEPVPPGDVHYEPRRRRAVIVHNNWANNKTVKMERFRQHGLWNLSPAMLQHQQNITATAGQSTDRRE
jgi:Nucleotide-diphospho-sugar transferase